jgi:gamma-glutamyltranspeptidase/glutathione hydrolase
MRNLRIVAIGVCLVGVASGWSFAQSPAPASFARGAVAADHPVASEAGVEILRRGGNVIDAAVATGFTLSVVRPASSGLGGGGFLVYWDAAAKQAVAYDYRERAPKAATADMYAADIAAGRADASQRGARAVAVPGQIVGLYEIHARHGKLSFATVLEPALRAARDGVAIDPHDREIRQSTIRSFTQHPEYREQYAALWRGYLNEGKPLGDGERFHSPQRATLEVLARDGATAFTRGELGAALVAEVRKQGGLIAADDLLAMSPVLRQPLRAKFRAFEIITMPPPSSGGVALLQVLQILEAWAKQPDHVAWESLPDAERCHILAEAFKHAFANRAEYLGDADFVDVPLKRLLDPDYAAQLAARIDRAKTFPPEHYGRQLTADDKGTTHFCVMDAQGNAVSCTETINTVYGSHVVEPKFGLVLNNEMDDFTAVPGKPNAFGLRQSAANAVAPGKKPLSSMTPTIVLRDGRPVLIVGGSGGPRIISATTQVLLHVLLFDRTANDAVERPRLHHQWQPDDLLLEAAWHPQLEGPLSAKGHKVRTARELAVTQAIRWTRDGIEPASDPRKHGRPAGY